MTERTYISVDPGGAFAWSNRLGVFAITMPDTRRDMIDLVKRIKSEHEGSVEPVAYMEKVVPYIPDAGGSMMFQYGRNVERPGCILETLDVRTIEISPQAWQKELNLGKSERIQGPRMPLKLTRGQKMAWRVKHKGELETVRAYNAKAKREWKSKLKSEAQRRFPQMRVTLFTCDALLILEVAIKLEGEQLAI